jgi:hypothetical protein
MKHILEELSMRITTHIKANTKRQNILGSVIGQMSDGIWENTRSMEKYWKSLDYGVDANGYIYLEDRNGVTADVFDFFANKIKQIIKVEIEDGYTSGLVWSRTCSVVPSYFHGQVTVGDCYEMYELLKGRNTSKYCYATYNPYTVTLSYAGSSFDFTVEALNESGAKEKAKQELLKKLTASIR